MLQGPYYLRNRPEWLMDPLSDVLSLLKPRSYMAGGFDAGGGISVRFPEHEGIKCYAVVSGQCWLAVEGVADPVRLGTGDCFLLPRGRPFRLASDLTLTPVDAYTLFRAKPNGGVASYNGGGECSIVGGHFVLDGDHADILLAMLPPIVHIGREADKAALRWSLEQDDAGAARSAAGRLSGHRASRPYDAGSGAAAASGGRDRGGVGWLFALADKQMGAAINAMHDDPAHRWTLQALAERAGMSRSTFALKFKETVGASPMDYLTRWRMLLAGDRLTNSNDPVSVIALSLGYESESAFSTAFKRVMGCSPRQYSRGRTPAAPSRSEREAASASRLEPVAG